MPDSKPDGDPGSMFEFDAVALPVIYAQRKDLTALPQELVEKGGRVYAA